MADAGDSKSPALTGVPVQVRGPVFGVKPYTAQVCAPFIRGAECYKSFGISGIYPLFPDLPFRAVTLGDRKMGRKRNEKPRLHKASGRAFIELGSRRIYLEAAYGTKEAEQEYSRLYGQWLANDRKPPPSKDTEVSGVTCGELAIRYLDWAKGYHIPKEGEPAVEYDHCRRAIGFLTKHFRDVPAVKFTALSLDFLQEKLSEHRAKNKEGRYARPTIRKYINIIRDAFRRGVKYHGVPAEIHYVLLSHEHLKRGKTKAHEYRKPKSVPDAIVDKTLPFMTPVIADMVRVQRLTGCRPKEIRIMRLCDIDRETYWFLPRLVTSSAVSTPIPLRTKI